MIFRFCLYGFLKNQQYYDPFLILAFREKGLSFAMIGLLIGFREACINLMEIPTGAIADVLGRRRSMIASFLAYIVAFAVFGSCVRIWMLFAAMFFFAIGEAFRTGTHKAMIFDWLTRQGRANEKTKVYGLTRSWSEMGSAVCVVIAAVLVFVTKQFSTVFYFSIVPYSLNIFNFLTYPAYLDCERKDGAGLREIARTLVASVRDSLRRRSLRRLLGESMAFEGCFNVTKDYLQPIIKTAVLAIPFCLHLADRQRTAVLVGAVYFVLHLMSSAASLHADSLVRHAGSPRRSARWLWWAFLGAFGLLSAGSAANLSAVAIAAFIILAILQNFWRPILISRVAGYAKSSQTATVLSIESQAKSLFTAVLAPLLGLAVDLAGKWTGADGSVRFLPVGVLGVVIAAGILATARSRRRRTG